MEQNCGDLVAVYHTEAQPQKPPAIHHICLLRYYGGGGLFLSDRLSLSLVAFFVLLLFRDSMLRKCFSLSMDTTDIS
jgi:hypothetical protein